jgi:hypothetical protein
MSLLARLDRYIAEAEALASRSSDPETLRQLDQELARLRDARRQHEKTLYRTKLLNGFARWTLIAFCVSFVVLSVLAILGLDGTRLTLAAVDILFIIVAGTVYLHFLKTQR